MLNVPNAFISMVLANAPMSCGVPSRATVRPPPTPPPATFTRRETAPSERARSIAAPNGVVVVRVAARGSGRAADVLRQVAGAVTVEVEHDDRHPDVREVRHRRGSETAGTTSDDGRTSR